MRPPPSQLLLWGLLALPAAAILVRYVTGAITYGEVIHLTGEWSVRWLVAVLAVTPLRWVSRGAGWAQWLVRRRRDLGVAAFAYALLHLVVYLERKSAMPVLIVREAADPGMAVGWLAFVLFALLAVTSNDASVRLLKRGWKALHRWVYPATALVIAHWVMTAFDPLWGWIYGAVVAALGAARLLRRSPRAKPDRVRDGAG